MNGHTNPKTILRLLTIVLVVSLLVLSGAGPLAEALDDAVLRPDLSAPPIDSLQVARLAETRISKGLDQEPLLPLYVAPAFLGPSKP